MKQKWKKVSISVQGLFLMRCHFCLSISDVPVEKGDKEKSIEEQEEQKDEAQGNI